MKDFDLDYDTTIASPDGKHTARLYVEPPTEPYGDVQRAFLTLTFGRRKHRFEFAASTLAMDADAELYVMKHKGPFEHEREGSAE